MVEQGLTIAALPWRHDRDLLRGQFRREAVFLADRRIAPALGTIELGYHRRLLVDAHLDHAVLVAVQREQMTIGQLAG